MANEILEVLFRVNLAAAAAILVVLAVRKPLRRLIGARLAYALWLVVPVSVVAGFLPPRQVVSLLPGPGAAPSVTTAGESGAAAGAETLSGLAPAVQASFWGAPLDWTPIALTVWLAVAAAALGLLLWRQRQFLAHVGQTRRQGERIQALRSGVGPAVVGVLSPKILVPADFDQRFSPREQTVVLAHEAFHLEQGHAQTNALVLLAQCLNWFNPLIHVASQTLRLDQELACDAAVVARHPNARRSYAEAMLKTQLAPTALPLGCYWPAKAPSALKQRLAMLRAAPPSRSNMLIGGLAAVGLAIACGLAAWAAQPAEQVYAVVPRVVAPAPGVSAAVAAAPAQEAAPFAAPLPVHLSDKAVAQAQAIAAKAVSAEEVADARAGLAEELDLARLAYDVAQATADAEVALQDVRYAQALVSAFDRGVRSPRPTVAPRPPRDVISIEPGHKVMVETSATTPSGRKIGGEGVFTAGDPSVDGHYQADARYSLISDVRQIGDEVEITPKFYFDGELMGSATVRLRSGETRDLRLSNGQLVRAGVKVSRLSAVQRAAYARQDEMATRQLPWKANSLEVFVNADVYYRPGRASHVIISGPKSEVDAVTVEEGEIRYRKGYRAAWSTRDTPRLRIVVSAPSIIEFVAGGAQAFYIDDYRADEISLRLSGAGLIQVRGSARFAEVRLSGAGKIDLTSLALSDAELHMSGAGTIVAAPQDNVEARVTGVGSITLLGEPRSLEKRVTGIGTVKVQPTRRASATP